MAESTSVLVKGGRVVTAADDYRGDVLIVGETVTAIGQSLAAGPGTTVIDAAGKLVIPGGIDPHVHMQLPFGGTVSSDDFETGTRAAAVGGTTSIIDFAIQYHGKTFAQTLDDWHAKAVGRCAIDYGFHLAVTRYEQHHAEEFQAVIASGVPTFKLFLAYPNVFLVDDRTMYRVMRDAGAAGGLTLVHAENGVVIEEVIQDLLAAGKTEPKYHAQSRPPVTEVDGIERALRVAELAGAPVFIVHVSTGAGAEAIRRARAAGQRAFGETCTQYLFFDDSKYDQPDFEGAKYVFTPPLRPAGNSEPLWDALRLGALQEVSTDHCPFFFKGQKELGRDSFTKIPNGGPGVEDRLAVVFDGAMKHGFSLNKWVEITSTASAKMFGMYPKKGTVAVGSDADLVIFDPERSQVRSAATHATHCDYNLFEGMRVQGVVDTVLSRGKVVVEDGKYVGSAGDGQFLKRGRCGVV